MLKTNHNCFLDYIKINHLFQKDDLLIVAISGGLDSVVLAHLLHKLQQLIVLAHCNFQLRGEESDRDEQFVRQLAGEWQVPVFVETFDTKAYATGHKLSTQVAARQLRYVFFERLRKQLSTQGKRVLIATAHHANDVAETMLMHLFRGTGIDGLRGIPVKNGFVVRPLLFAKREEIEEYAKANNLLWVEDSSNAKQDYTRNYIRHTILPAIAKQFPGVIDQLWSTAEKLRDVSDIYHETVARKLGKWVQQEGKGQKMPVLRLMKSPQVNALLWEWIKQFGYSEGQVEEVKKLFNASNGAYIASSTHRIIRNRAWLLLTPVEEKESTFFVVDHLPAVLHLPNGKTLKLAAPEPFEASVGILQGAANEAIVNAEKVKLPLLIRPWKQGDYFYPLGMAKKKKVARFLIDQKVSPVHKPNVYVVESEKRIIWIAGYRMDDRVKIMSHTTEVVKMNISLSG